MSPLVAVAAGLVVFEGVRGRLSERRALVAAVAVAGLVWQPIAAALAGVAVAAVAWHRRLAARRRRAEQAAADVPLLAELVLLGLTAGLPFAAALEAAIDEVHEDLAADIRRVLRRARRHGMAAALTGGGGPAEAFLRPAAQASVTGAPLAAAVSGFVEQARHSERTRALAAARKLPVRLLLPLALLILPGFVVLTVGPALLGGLERLQL